MDPFSSLVVSFQAKGISHQVETLSVMIEDIQRALGHNLTSQIDLHTTQNISVLREGTNTKIDIVAVHGLYGHQINSWTASRSDGKRTMWLRDLLPQHLPNARIMSFGYHSNGPADEVITMTTILNAARNLLLGLKSLREDIKDKNRPIVFITHEFGGFIVKQALLLGDREPDLGVSENTHDLVFLGTPHRATSLYSWEDIIYDIANNLPVCPKKGLRKAVRDISYPISELTADFNALAGRYKLTNVFGGGQNIQNIISGESMETTKYNFTLDVPCEEQISRDRSLAGISKFSKDDDDFKAIMKTIKMTDSNFDNEYRQCLQTLSNLSPPIKPPPLIHGKFDWITSHDVYKSWLFGSKPSILLIHGDQGAGKSALSHFIFQSIYRSQISHARIVYFSFDRYDDRRNSVKSLMISLTHQILACSHDLFHQVRSKYTYLKEEKSWTKDDLWVLLRTLLASSDELPVICVINAIHHCDESRRQLLHDLVALRDTVNKGFKVLFTSGYDAEVLEVLSLCPKISINGQVNAEEDMKLYIENGVAQLIETRPFLAAFGNKIKKRLSERNDYLWASFVLEYLAHARIQSTESALVKTLEDLPFNVSGLVRDSLAKISIWAKLALSWIVYAIRPMRIRELAVALAISSSIEVSPASIRENMAHDLVGDLKDNLGMLIKVEDGEVRLAHSFIREFLENSTGKRDGHAESFELRDHWAIANDCMHYISMDAIQIDGPLATTQSEREDTVWDFLKYAVQYWPAHYRNVSNKTGKHTQTVLEFLSQKSNMRKWAELYWRFSNPDIRQDACLDSTLHLAAQLGFSDVVATMLSSPNLDEEFTPKDRAWALELAAQSGYPDVVKQFLDERIKTSVIEEALQQASIRGKESVVRVIVASIAESQRTVHLSPIFICRAAQNGHLDLVKQLHRAGSDINADVNGSTPLHIAAANGRGQVVQYLIDQSANVNVLDATSSSPLLLASWKGFSTIVSQLIEANVDLDLPRNDGLTALHLAALNGHLEIVQLLLRVSKSPKDLLNSGKSSPLHLACSRGHIMTVELLINSGADIQIRDSKGCSPLILAASRGYSKVVESLVSHGSILESTDDEGFTAFYSAVSNGFWAIAELLLLRGADPNPKEILDSTPLILAVKSELQSMIELILKKGAYLDREDKDGLLAIHHAASLGNNEILDLLIKKGADIQVSDKSLPQRTPLAHAVLKGRATTTEFLIQHGANIEFQNSLGQTALHLASGLGHDSITQLLLQYGSKQDTVDEAGSTALHIAADGGYLAVVKTLLDNGSEVDASNYSRHTPLHLSILGSHDEIVRYLIDQKANPKVVGAGGRSTLHNAAIVGSLSIIKLLFEKDNEMDLDERDGWGKSALHLSVEKNHGAATRLLLEFGSNVNAKDDLEHTPLVIAIQKQLLEITQLLLEYRASLDMKDEIGWFPLHHACANGNMDIIRLLLGHKHGVEFQDDDGWRPIHVAAMHGKAAVLELLHDHQADLKARVEDGRTALSFSFESKEASQWFLDHGIEVDAADNDGVTPLMLATRVVLPEVVDMFLSYGANAKAIDINRQGVLHHLASGKKDVEINRKKTVAELLIKGGANIDAQDDMQNTALIKVIESEDSDLVKILIEAGAGLEIKCSNNNTALLAAISVSTANVVYLLISAGASLEAKTHDGLSALTLALDKGKEDIAQMIITYKEGPPVDGVLALQMASYQGRETIVKLLLERNVDVNAQTERWNTALQSAILGNNMAVIEELSKWNLDVNIRGGVFGYALSAAALNFPDAVPFLLEQGAQVMNVDDQGRYALHHGAQNGRRPIFQRLLDAPGSKIDVEDKQKRTVIHHAAVSGSLSVIKQVLESNPELNRPDIDGWTPLHWACKEWNPATIQLLLNNGANPTQPCLRGWTPQHITLFHGQEDLMNLLDSTESTNVATSKDKPRSRQRTWPRIVSGQEHYSFCDGCGLWSGGNIFGIRFHCETCPDFDFCFKCHWTASSTHPGHTFAQVGTGPIEGPIIKAPSDDDSDSDSD